MSTLSHLIVKTAFYLDKTLLVKTKKVPFSWRKQKKEKKNAKKQFFFFQGAILVRKNKIGSSFTL